MDDMTIAVYDKKKVFEQEIQPIFESLVKACNINRIPIFACAAVASSEESTEFKTIGLNPTQYNFILKDNKFTEFTNVMNGFQTYYNGNAQEANEEYDELLELMNAGEKQAESKNNGNND